MPALVTLAVTLAILIIGAMRQPSLAFAALFVQIGLDQLALAAHRVFATNPALMNAFVAGLVGFGVAYRLFRGQVRGLAISTPWVLVIALYGYAWITLVWAPAIPRTPGAAFASNYLWKYFPYFILYVLLGPLFVRKVSDLRGPFEFVVIMCLLLLTGLIMFGEFHEAKRGLVVAGTDEGTSPLPLATFSGVAILAGVFIRSEKHEKAFLVLRPVIMLLALIAIVGSGTRGQLFAALLVTAVVWPLTQEEGFMSRYLKLFSVVLILLLSIWIAFEVLGDRFAGRWSVGDAEAPATIYGRFMLQVEMIGNVLPVWQTSPATIIFGVGNSGSFALLPGHFYPHNVPLEVLLEEGVLGFALFSGALVLAYRSFRRLLGRYRGDRRAIGNICFLFATGLFYLLLSLKQGSFANHAHLFLFAAIVIANLDHAESRGGKAHGGQGASEEREGKQVGPVGTRESPPGGNNSR